MRVATLSFELQGDSMKLLGRERAQRVMAAVRREPDLLVCAGWTLDTEEELEGFSKELAESGSCTAVVLEVRYDRRDLRENANLNFLLRQGVITPLGRQVFATGEEYEKEKEAAYQVLFPEKSTQFDGRSLTLLCCGEINVLKGRNNPTPRCFHDELLAADIIVNPTHDRMGQAGTVQAKRRWLSQKVGGRNRLYVSASNWNSAKPIQGKKDRILVQKPTAPTLHTVFRNGESVHLNEGVGLEDNYLYRECEVSL